MPDAPQSNRSEAGTILRPVQVVGISGSLRSASYTTVALRHALAGAAQAGATTALVDLRNFALPFASAEGMPLSEYPDVPRLKQIIRDAQGVILATPEYHGSFSGVLKNALDLMGFEEFEGKMIGLVGVSAGRTGAYDALNSLRNIGRALHAWVVPEQVSIPAASSVFDQSGAITKVDIEDRLILVGRRVADFARLHDFGRASEFLEQWQVAMENPGG